MTDLDAWQYRISRDESRGSVSFGDYFLTVGPGIGRHQVVDAQGTDVGWIIGFPIDLAGEKLVSERLTVPAVYDGDPNRFAETVLESLAGRFLWAASLGDELRLYPDCSALVPCVFDPDKSMAGSTATALMSDTEYQDRFLSEAYSGFGIDQHGWFPGGLTAHQGLERLLPNHFLDLRTWQCHRFWPKKDLRATLDPEASIKALIDQVRRQLSVLSKADKTVAISLTAGRDTRILLACARPFINDVVFTTVVAGDSHSCDTVMARKISRDLGLNHIELPRCKASPERRDRYLRRGGHCVADGNSWFFPSVAPIAQNHVMFGGAGGEAGRAFYWKDTDTSSTELNGRILAGRFGFPGHPVLVERLDNWLEQTRQTDSLVNLDLAYIEHRMGPWGGAQMCSDPTLVRFAPFVTQPIIESLLTLPPEWKRSQGIVDEVMKIAWPELSRYPFNSLGPLRDNIIKIQKVVRHPSLVLGRIRKMLAK